MILRLLPFVALFAGIALGSRLEQLRQEIVAELREPAIGGWRPSA